MSRAIHTQLQATLQKRFISERTEWLPPKYFIAERVHLICVFPLHKIIRTRLHAGSPSVQPCSAKVSDFVRCGEHFEAVPGNPAHPNCKLVPLRWDTSFFTELYSIEIASRVCHTAAVELLMSVTALTGPPKRAEGTNVPHKFQSELTAE